MSFEKRDGKVVIYNIETGEEWVGAGIDARELFAQGGWSKESVAVSREAEVVTEVTVPEPVLAPESVSAVEEIIALDPVPSRRPGRRPKQA